MPICVNCGSSVEGAVYRNTLCSACGKELHTCRNCRHYAPGKPYDCAESIGEPIPDKTRANFCDFFQINLKSDNGGGDSSGKSSSAKDAFDALFGE